VQLNDYFSTTRYDTSRLAAKPDFDAVTGIGLVSKYGGGESICSRTIQRIVGKGDHTGFSVDNLVRIEAVDDAGMQRLIEYIARCPFSLSRMVSLTDDGKILYRASKPGW
jgi:hypothetical protein